MRTNVEDPEREAFYKRIKAMRPFTMEMELAGRAWPGYIGDRAKIGAIIDGEHIVYLDEHGNHLEPSWVLRTLRGTDEIPGPDPEEHPWMQARAFRAEVGPAVEADGQ
jgi:hypothetical protein